jgi:hypothetical protein
MKVEVEKAKYMWLIYRDKKWSCDRANHLWLHYYISEEYHNHQDEGQQPNGNVEEHEPVRVCDVIRITGKRENCEAAQKALLDLKPVTVEVSSELTRWNTSFRNWYLLKWQRNSLPFMGPKGSLLCSQRVHHSTSSFASWILSILTRHISLRSVSFYAWFLLMVFSFGAFQLKFCTFLPLPSVLHYPHIAFLLIWSPK